MRTIITYITTISFTTLWQQGAELSLWFHGPRNLCMYSFLFCSNSPIHTRLLDVSATCLQRHNNTDAPAFGSNLVQIFHTLATAEEKKKLGLHQKIKYLQCSKHWNDEIYWKRRQLRPRIISKTRDSLCEKQTEGWNSRSNKSSIHTFHSLKLKPCTFIRLTDSVSIIKAFPKVTNCVLLHWI